MESADRERQRQRRAQGALEGERPGPASALPLHDVAARVDEEALAVLEVDPACAARGERAADSLHSAVDESGTVVDHRPPLPAIVSTCRAERRNYRLGVRPGGRAAVRCATGPRSGGRSDADRMGAPELGTGKGLQPAGLRRFVVEQEKERLPLHDGQV